MVHQNLTSNQDETILSDEARQIIGEIKLNESKRVQEKLYNEVEKTISLNRRDYHDNTTLKEVDPDMRSIITQNILLKQLNKEIRSKNTLLENTIELMKNNKPIMYSEITKSNKKIIKQMKVPEIKIFNKTENIDAESAFKKITEVLQNDIVIPFKKVINTKKSGIIVKCVNSDDVTRKSDILQSKLGENFEVKLQQQNKPKLKIFGISTELNKDEVENDINERNFYKFEDKCKILHIFNCANKTQGVIIEVSMKVYEHIVNNQYKVCVGYQCCKAYDDLNMNLGFNCAGFNHNCKKCNKTLKCTFCAGNHVAKNCSDGRQYRCVN